MDFVNFLPGVSTPTGNRDATINGLPRGTINITLDGVNIQDNTLQHRPTASSRSSARASTRLKRSRSTTRGAGRGRCAGQGAVQVEVRDALGHATRSRGSGYYYYRSDKLQRQHLVQQPQRRRQGEAEAEPDRRPRSAVRS